MYDGTEPDELAVFEKALASLIKARGIMKDLAAEQVEQRDVTDPRVAEARAIIREIRDGIDAGSTIEGMFRDMRDNLVATLYGTVPKLGVEELAADAGFNSSFVSRVAAKMGARRRTVRPPQERPEGTPAGD